jgi:hypothetical protein
MWKSRSFRVGERPEPVVIPSAKLDPRLGPVRVVFVSEQSLGVALRRQPRIQDRTEP